MITAFLTAKIAAGKASRTIDYYRRELGAALAWMQARGSDLDGATAEQIEQHLAEERARGMSAASVSARYRAISAYLRWRHARQRSPGQPVIADVARPQIGKKEPRRTTPDQIERLIASIEPATWIDLRDRALLRIMFWSGLRVGETAALALGDLDTAARRLHVRSGKGGKARIVPYHPAAAPDLLGYLFSRPDAAGAVYLWSAGNGAGGATNSALTDNGIRQILRRRCKAAGMVTINPHALRHGFAMEMLNNGGATMEAVSRMLGHASPEITRRFYADYLDEEIAAIYNDAIQRSAARRQK